MENSNTFGFDFDFDFNKLNFSINFNIIYQLIEKYKFVLFFLQLLIVFLLIILLMIIFYIIIKFLEISLDKMVFFYDYNKLCKKILKKYGDCEINKIYLIRSSLNQIYTILLNIITLFKYDELVKMSEDNFPYHTMLLLEVKLKNDDDKNNKNKVKLLLLEKNNCITINDNFILTQGMHVEEVEINKNKKEENKIYLKDFLEETRNRMGNEKFFNWHLFENNCQEFTKELLITAGSYDDYYKKIIFSNNMFKLIHPSEFFYCMFNCLCIIYNFLEKYIFEINLFDY
jgi:hypothetical protein